MPRAVKKPCRHAGREVQQCFCIEACCWRMEWTQKRAGKTGCCVCRFCDCGHTAKATAFGPAGSYYSRKQKSQDDGIEQMLRPVKRRGVTVWIRDEAAQ